MGKRTSAAFKKNLTGTGDDDVLNGSSGFHRLLGGSGSDQIIGSAGSDTIRAGDGDDVIFAGGGDDFIFGNDGTDTLILSDLSSMSIGAGKGNSWIVESSDGTDTIKHIEFISDGTYTYAVGQNNGVFGLASEAGTDEDSTVTIDLLASAFDVENDSFSITSLDAISAAGAAVTLNADGTVSYDPGMLFQSLAQGEQATDTFAYTVTDAAGNTSTQTMTVTINGLNDAPEFTGGDTSGRILLPQGSGEASVSSATILRANVVDNTNLTAVLDVAVLNDGTKVVVSNQSNHANNGGKTFVSMVDADGNETEIFQDNLTGTGQSVVALADGGFAVAYSSGRHDVQVHTYDADGQLLSSHTLNSLYVDANVGLTALESGGFAVSYVRWKSGNNYEERLAVFDSSGGLVTGPIHIDSDHEYGSGVSITELAEGGFAVLSGYGSNHIYPLELLILDETGGIQSSTTVSDGNRGAGNEGSVAQLSDGSIVVSYSVRDGIYSHVFEIFDAQGNQLVERTAISEFAYSNSHYERASDIVPLEDGGFAIAYQNHGTKIDPATGMASQYGIYVRTFNADGTPASDDIFVGQGHNPGLDIDADGNLTVVALGSTGNATLWTVTPPNSGPDISGAHSESGILIAEDADHGAELTFAFVEGARYGTVEVDAATGEWIYTLDPDSNVIADGAGRDSFEVSVIDEFGAADIQTVTVEFDLLG